MTTYVAYRDGGLTNEIGLGRMNSKLWDGHILEGLIVVATNPLGMNITISSGDLQLYTYSSSLYAWSDSDEVVSVSTADVSNPRIDRVIAYIDLTETPITDAANNPGSLKFASITGIPSANPEPATDGTVQSAVGTGNPWCELAILSVGTAVSQIITADITNTTNKLTLAQKIGPPNLAPAIAGDQGWRIYDFGTIRLYSRQYSFAGGGNLASGANRVVGTIHYPPGENGTTLHRTWSSRMSSNAPFFNAVLENNTIRILNVTQTTILPGTVTIDVLCFKHQVIE